MKKKKLVSIVMGSQSDWKTLINCENIFKNLGIDFEKKIVSAHRTPDRLYEFATNLTTWLISEFHPVFLIFSF